MGGANGLPALPLALAFGEGGAEAAGGAGPVSEPLAFGGDRRAGGATRGSGSMGSLFSREPRGSPDEVP
eukprot:13306549-Alexandrium_andersonii.AAC.1